MTTLNVPVITSLDDMYEQTLFGPYNTTYLYAQFDGDYIGIRFQDLDIPSGQTIDSAVVTLEIEWADADDVSGDWYGEDNATPATFVVTANNLLGRTLTSTSVNHTEYDIGGVGTSFETPDLKSILQELEDSYDGIGDLVLIYVHDTSSVETNWASYDHSWLTEPQIDIDYTPASTQYEQSVSGSLGSAAGVSNMALEPSQIRPASDVSDGGGDWDSQPTPGQDLYAQIDETSPSDTDYIEATV